MSRVFEDVPGGIDRQSQHRERAIPGIDVIDYGDYAHAATRPTPMIERLYGSFNQHQ
jgi:hypothetical protein